MQFPFYVFLFFTGASVGFFSGLLGIGGGILMFPILLYAPGFFGFEAVPVKSITGLTMVQGFFASLSAMLFYRKHGLVNKSLALTLGISLFASSLGGSFASRVVSDGVLVLIFGMMALSASVIMLIPRSYEKDELTADKVDFNKTAAILIGIGLGLLLGLVGQGGAFIMIPVLLYALKIPLRVALGSTLAIGLFSSTAGLIGKAATGQVPSDMAIALLLGAMPSAKLGGIVSRRTDTKFLRWLLAFIISATAVKVCLDIFRQ